MSVPKTPFKPEFHVAVEGEPADSSAVNASFVIPLQFKEEAKGQWVPIVSCAVSQAYTAKEFSKVVDALVRYPERNSPLILRADIQSDVDLKASDSFEPNGYVSELHQCRPTRLVRRLLCPRSPKRDLSLEQSCVFYTHDGGGLPQSNDQAESVLVLSPDLSSKRPTPPFYHPAVAHLAMRYVQGVGAAEEGPSGRLAIEVVRLASDSKNNVEGFPTRLVKTCVSLLEGIHRVGYGFANGYRKRVDHDTLVDKAEFQDLYLKMKEMHGGLVETWQESTDPSKHVFEDIGIATFLMLLWKSQYQDSSPPEATPNQKFPWSHYTRPPGGFRDIACGNGLLTHILVASGYEGFGIDLRARKSWEHFGPETQARLKVEALDFTSIQYNPTTKVFTGIPEILMPNRSSDQGRVFFIGNHADELTPWMPLIAHAAGADFLSVPCCFWALDGRFHAQKKGSMPGPSFSPHPIDGVAWEHVLADRLYSVLGKTADGKAGGKKSSKEPSQYGRYMLWLARIHRSCGYEVEVEALRIPSTRNWAFAGIHRTWKSDDELVGINEYVDGLIGEIRQRGQFKTRVPEGKVGGFMTLYGE